MKRISLDDLLHTRQNLAYSEQYGYIMKLLEKGQIKPVKASKSNGKKPALYREYWMVEEQKDYSNYIEEIKYTFSTMISVDYYLAHPDTYEKDRIWVLMLNEYLKKHADALLTAESLNERSFEIWHREKFLVQKSEPYMKHPENTIYYFGDLDYEGIGIYENLAEKFRSRWKILPFVPAYQAMLGKAEQINELPETKEHQNRNISTQFFSCFDEIMVKKMEAILDKDRYIPQEILNTADF